MSRRMLYWKTVSLAPVFYERHGFSGVGDRFRNWIENGPAHIAAAHADGINLDEGRIGLLEDILFNIMLHCAFTGSYAKIARALDARIATQLLLGPKGEVPDLPGVSHDSSLDTLKILRCELHDVGLDFPAVVSLQQAIALRNDPNWKAFREQFKLFLTMLSKGNMDGVLELRSEVKKAREALHRARSMQAPLRWLTYLSLPVSVAETLLLGVPLFGTSISIAAVCGTAISDVNSRKHRWALFGR